MRLSKDLLGKPIYTISDGRHIGDAKDLYLSAELQSMAGIYLRREGLVRRKDVLIPIDSVVVFGIDAILIKNEEAVTDSKAINDAAGWVRLNDIIGRVVDTPGGTKVGVIGDVVLDEDGSIAGFALSRVFVEGPISEKRLIRHDAIIDNGNVDGRMTVDIARAESPEGLDIIIEKKPEEPVTDALPDGEQDVRVSAESAETPANDLESPGTDQPNSEGEPSDV